MIWPKLNIALANVGPGFQPAAVLRHGVLAPALNSTPRQSTAAG